MQVEYAPLSAVAEELGVSRRRAQALVEEGALPAQRLGHQWVVSRHHVARFAHNRQLGPGRPCSAEGLWQRIWELQGAAGIPRDRSALDACRRALRPRAHHEDLYVHPGVLERLRARDGVVLSGRSAAATFAPVDDDGVVDAYVRQSGADALKAALRAEAVLEGSNVRLHIVPDDAWPFAPSDQVVPPFVAWLDLEDALDRGADTVLDRLLGGRPVA